MTKKSDYFLKRSEVRMHKAHQDVTEVIELINKHYDKSLKQLNDDIDRIIGRLSKDVTHEEALQYLNQTMTNEEYDKLLEQFKMTKNKSVKKQLKARLNAQAAKYRITRKEAIIESINRMRLSRIDQHLSKGNEHMIDTFFDVFSGKLKDKGFKSEMIGISAQRIQEVIDNKWSGENYSDRVWDNQTEVANRTKELIFRHLETGTPTSKLANELRDLTQMGKYATNRLLRTETSYIVNMADLEAAKRLGVTKRKFIATLDSRTSSLCRKHNNQIVAIEDTKIGINTPPLHPFCRSVMIDIDESWEELEDFKEKTKKDEEKSKIDYMAKHKLFDPSNSDMKANKLFVANNKNVLYRISSKSTDPNGFIWYKSKTKKTRETIHLVEQYFANADKSISKPKNVVITPNYIYDKKKEGKTKFFAGYEQKEDVLFINEEMFSEDIVKELLKGDYFSAKNFTDMLNHEMAHKLHWDNIKKVAKQKGKGYNISVAKEELETELRRYIKERESYDPSYIKKEVSENALEGKELTGLNELVADGFVKILNGTLVDKELERLVKGVLGL